MSEEDFETPNMKSAMAQLMKSEEGRELAEKLRAQLKKLNDQFKGLSGDEKKKFLGEFREKMSKHFGDLKEGIKSKLGGSDDGEFKIRDDSESSIPQSVVYNPSPNYWLFFIAFLAIIAVFGFFGYKLYLSIMEKETKKERKTRKQLKEEKKTQSPPASPRSKKQD